MKSNLLVVDDDAAVREAMDNLLTQAGYEVVTAADSRQAAEVFDGARTHLLILDLDLPFKHALEAFGPLTSLSAGVPILLITNQPDRCPAALMPDVGALLEKPVDVDLLLRTIAELLAGPKELCFHASCDCHKDPWHNTASRQPSSTDAIQLRFQSQGTRVATRR